MIVNVKVPKIKTLPVQSKFRYFWSQIIVLESTYFSKKETTKSDNDG